MNQEERAIDRIRKSAGKRKRAETARREATIELRRHCEEARKLGIGVARIACEAGLSRQAVYDLLAGGIGKASSR